MPQEKLDLTFPLVFTDQQANNVYKFPVLFDITGNQHNPGMTITTGHNGTVISTSPGWKLTVSADPDKDGVFTEVMTTSLTGTIKSTTLADGGTQFFYNGHNLIGDPRVGGEEGIQFYKLSAGHFSYTGDSSGNAVEPLSGHGQLVDLLDYIFS